MADQQPGDLDPAAGTPDPTSIQGDADRSTVDAPVRWSGSAAVPPPVPKKSRWSRRRPEPDDRVAVPAVDPWAGHDTPVDPFPVALEIPLPPTTVEPPKPPPPPPPPPAPPPPPKISRRERKARERAARELAAARQRQAQVIPPVNRLPVQARPLPAPPPWQPRQPPRPLPPPPRKRRRWGRRLFLLTVFGVVCCCGVPFAWYQFPAARQYPVTANLPQYVGDLTRRDDNASKRAADRLAAELKGANAKTDDVFAGIYGDRNGKRVTVFGVTGWRFSPAKDVRTELNRLSADFDLSDVQTFDLGEPGVHESCGVGRKDGAAVVVCSWADHGSLATVLLTRRSVTDSAGLVGRLRSAVLTPG